jgi:RNA polymerase sigma factor (sigma-70 family)
MQSSDTHDQRQRLNEAASGPYEHDAKPSGFEEFYRREFHFVARYLLRLGASYQDAQDVAQEVFVNALQNWDRISAPRPWTRTVATRILFRRNAQAARTITIPDFPGDLLPAAQDTVESQLEAAEIRKILGLLRSLPPLQRAVMAMRYDGIPSNEIAAALDISESTVRVHLHKARRQLKELLALGDSASNQDGNDAEELR